MAKRNRNLWRVRRRSAVQSAERLVATTAKSVPVNLLQVGAHRGVKKIEFAQLLTDGGLAVCDDGFMIYVRCDAGEDADLTARFAGDGTGGTLPGSVVCRARFTIAHEIAHTFFYDLRSTPPRPKTEVTDGLSAARLEIACNEIAGLLVIPESVMESNLSELDRIRPKDLRALADKAIVSPQTLIRRFKHLRNLSHPEAILVSVTCEGNDWIINAISHHYSMRSIFVSAKPGAPLSTLINDPDFALFGGEHRDTFVEYLGHGGKRMKMQFECEVRTWPRGRNVFVVGTPPAI